MRAKIIVLENETAIAEYLLSKDKMVVGRKAESDITIPDTAVSGLHANIIKKGNSYQIVDLDSTNGVHIEGQKISKQMLKDGDIMIVGEHKLKYVEGDSETQSAGSPAPRAPVKTVVEPINAYLMVLSGENENQQIDLNDSLTSIGTPGIQMAAISQRPKGHFIIHVDGGEDHNRVPLVNGEPIGFKSRKLEGGDKIEVAGIEMQYQLSDVTVIKLN